MKINKYVESLKAKSDVYKRQCQDDVENGVGSTRTHTGMCTVTACRTSIIKCEKEATFFMASQVMRITLKARCV